MEYIDDGEKSAVNESAPVLVANPTSSTVYVNGTPMAFDAYNIEGNNYFKLRDLAFVLNGTEKQFEVAWDGEVSVISLTSGQGYTLEGGEMESKGDGAKTPVPTDSKLLINGGEASLTAYNIANNNYSKLRDIGEVFDFGVDWDGVNNAIMIDTSKGYTPEGAVAPPTDTNTSAVLTRYSYSDLSISFEWGEDENNPNAIGGCTLKFTLDGDKSDVAKVLIAGWRQSLADNDVVQMAEMMVPMWRQHLLPGSFDGNVHTSFPIDAEELGTTINVLLLVLDDSFEATGHIIVAVGVPASIS